MRNHGEALLVSYFGTNTPSKDWLLATQCRSQSHRTIVKGYVVSEKDNVVEGNWFDPDVQKELDYQAEVRGLKPIFRRDELKKGTMEEEE